MFLSAAQVEGLYEKALLFAERKGFKVEHDGLLTALKSAGASADAKSQIVTFGRSLVEDALRVAPSSFKLAAIDPLNDLPLPHPSGGFYGRTNTGATRYLEPGGAEPRPVTLDDVGTWATLTGQMENIGFCGFPSVSNVPQEIADVEAMRRLLGASSKHVWVQPYTDESLKYLIEMALVAGGGQDELRKRPIMSLITCSLTPFLFKPMDAEVLLAACRQGIPIHACSLPSAGGTSPITPIGSVFVAAVEVLAMIVMAQLLAPGHPVIGTTLMFAMDMHSGRVNHSSPEALRAAAQAVQLVKQAFGVPTHTYGAGSDSPVFDTQTTTEAAVQTSIVALAGADILGAAGQFETATSISPLQLILDNEVMGLLKAVKRGGPIDDDALGWQTMLDVAHGGTFLTTDHTYEHCRDVWMTKLFTRDAPDVWRGRNHGDLLQRLEARYRDIIEHPAGAFLSDDVGAALDEVVGHARQALT